MAQKLTKAEAEEKAKPELARLVKVLRVGIGQSQGQFARTLDVTKDAVSQWESGRREPNRWLQEKLGKLAKRCGYVKIGEKINPMRWGPGDFISEPPELDEDDDRLAAGGPSPLTKQQRTNLRGQAHIEVDLIFDRAPDQVVKKVMDVLDNFAGKYTQEK